ncbi:MAG: glycosyltransferase [Desulfocapsaceae bacterium]|nr:glycosyltransferase [Desulfocapsaceae bacterium]
MTAIIIIYFICVLLLMVYGVNTHILTQLFKKRYPQSIKTDREQLHNFYNDAIASTDPAAQEKLPKVTTQLPVYNELNVVEGLIDAVVGFEYPDGRHEIQVLDDSSDETSHLIAAKVASLRRRGIDIHHITRTTRDGYKAGALRNGLKSASGDFIAIFDADFLPKPDFLLRVMPYFHNSPRLALVQASWGHLNENESLVTRLQAIGINAHFMIEQAARSANNLFLNFNGTAGVMRKEAIIDAGNWHGDTLTEDMDLSYRLQLRGWRCRFLAEVIAPAEIPSNLNGFKSQQFRWAKGSTQTALKLLPKVIRSSASPFAKFQACMHMTHYCIHPLMLTLAILAPIMLFQQLTFLTGSLLFLFGVLLLLSCSGPSRMYLVSEKTVGRSHLRTICFLPIMICFGCGLAVNNSRAVLEAVIGRTSEFVRTPKRGGAVRKAYPLNKNLLHFVEILVGLWCVFGVILYFGSHHYLIGHFMLLYASGFLFIGIGSWWHMRRELSA